MRRFVQLFWTVILPVCILAAVGWYFYDKLRKPELWSDAIHFRAEWLIPAAILYVVAQFTWGVYSVVLLRNQGGTITMASGLRAYFISQFGKYVPGKIWVILIRVKMLGNIGISKMAVGIAATYESLTAMSAGALIGAILLPMLANEQTSIQGTSVYWVTPFALAPIGLVGLNRFVNRVSRWRKGPNAPQLPRVKLHMVLLGLCTSMLGWALLGVSLWCCLNGLHAEVLPLTADRAMRLIAINAIAYVIGFLAVMMPAGGGIREIALQFLLTLELASIMPKEQAAALAAVTAIVLRLLWTTGEMLTAGLLYRLAPVAAINDDTQPGLEIPNE